MMRKIILSIAALLSITIIFIFFIPVKRSFNFKLSVQAIPEFVYQELLQTSEWNKWYFGDSINRHSPLAIQSVKQDDLVSYRLDKEEGKDISGTFKINISLEGGTFLEWNETIYLSKGIMAKIQLLLWPSSYRTTLENSLYKLRDNLERPAEIEAGVRFKVYQMKGHVIAAMNDTVSFVNAEQKIIQLYQKIRARFNQVSFTDTNHMTSRYELLNDSMVNVEVGLRLKDATQKVPAPLKRLEVPSVLIFIASKKSNYQQSGQMVQITHDWVKKYNLKLAGPFWFEHTVKLENGKYQMGDTLRIIQPFYYWMKPVEDIY